MSLSFIDQDILTLEQKNLKRTLRDIEGPQGREIVLNGRRVLNFCSNDYLGLADDERLKQSVVDAIKKEGVGAGASRLVCGNLKSHRELESALAQFKGTEACLTFSTGYMANIGIVSSLCNHGDIIFADKLNHASIIDGIILSGAKFKRYPHKDMKTLETWLQESQDFKKRIIITESVFSMDGDIALLDKIVALARKYNAIVMIDEAHGFGILGKNGKGAAEHFGVEKEIDIQMGTLSKAAGVFGAYCCGSQKLIEYLVNHARSFIYTTGLPPMVAAAARRAVHVIETEPSLRKQLWDSTDFVLSNLKQLGFKTGESQTPIIPIMVNDSQTALLFSKALLEAGIFVQAIRPPTVPINTARLRLTITAAHTPKDLECLLETIKKVGRELCLIP